MVLKTREKQMEWALYLIFLSVIGTGGSMHAEALKTYSDLSDCAEMRNKLINSTAAQRGDTILRYRCVPIPERKE